MRAIPEKRRQESSDFPLIGALCTGADLHRAGANTRKPRLFRNAFQSLGREGVDVSKRIDEFVISARADVGHIPAIRRLKHQNAPVRNKLSERAQHIEGPGQMLQNLKERNRMK